MNGELAVLISLATHGTEWLTGPRSVPAPNLARSQSAFKYVAHIEFPPVRRSWPRQDKAVPDVAAWLDALHSRGVRRLWLHSHRRSGPGDRAPHLATAFSNGGAWVLLAEANDSVEIWRAIWSFTRGAGESQASWHITFQAQGELHGKPEQPSVEEASVGLKEQLRVARTFASRQSLDRWESWFARALEPSTEIPYNPDLVPAGYPGEATRLMSMAARSWVWGGMGSWNDLSFAGEVGSEYARVSATLYDASCRAFVAATNAGLSA